MVSKKDMFDTAQRIVDYDAQIKAIEALRDADKALLTGEMERRGIEEIEIKNKVIRWTRYVRSSFDSASFKKDHPDVYSEYQKESVAHRFSISG